MKKYCRRVALTNEYEIHKIEGHAKKLYEYCKIDDHTQCDHFKRIIQENLLLKSVKAWKQLKQKMRAKRCENNNTNSRPKCSTNQEWENETDRTLEFRMNKKKTMKNGKNPLRRKDGEQCNEKRQIWRATRKKEVITI